MAAQIDIRPQAGPQEAFLSSSADIAIYGGAAGGGKTWGLLIEPARHIHNARFSAVGFRRTYPQIRNPGGLWDESQAIYPLFGAVANETRLEWEFPSGARVTFAHMQHEKSVHDWQGSQIALILWDELTHFAERMFWYMLSRNRSTCGVRPYVRATTNPTHADDPRGGWVRKLIDWWIGEDGLPIPERSGVLRWFVRINEALEWADDEATLRARHPGATPKSLTFIPANVHDNKILLAQDPGYLANLDALPLVEREQLKGGNWNVKPAAGKVINRAWFEIVGAAPVGGEECRGWDFAATAKELAKSDPDYTAGVKMRKVGGVFYILDSVDEQLDPAATERLFMNTTKQDAAATPARYMARWEVEPGSAGKREATRLTRELAPIDARGVPSRGDKLARLRGFAVQAEAGNVKLVRGAWNDRWLNHMHHLPDLAHDDIADATGLAFNELASTGGSLIR